MEKCMDLKAKLINLVMPAYRFGQNDIEYALELSKRGVGGFCLFWGTPGSVYELTSTVKERFGTDMKRLPAPFRAICRATATKYTAAPCRCLPAVLQRQKTPTLKNICGNCTTISPRIFRLINPD